MAELFPDWYGAITTINSSQTVVGSTDSKVSVNRRGNRRYLKLVNLGPNPEYLAFGMASAVKGSGFRLGVNDGQEFSIPNGNILFDSVSVISSASATGQRLLKLECY